MTPTSAPESRPARAASLTRLCFLAAFLALVSQGCCSSHPPVAWSFDRSFVVSLLPDPPKPGSGEQTSDLAAAHLAYSNATPQDLERAEWESQWGRASFIFCFTNVFRVAFETNRFPQTMAFFAWLVTETDSVADYGKDHWSRLRPYVVDPNYPCRGKLEGPDVSYPSGHSTRGTVVALALAELFPGLQPQFLKVGREIGWHRVQLGKHYPLDIYAGRVLGQEIFRQLKETKAFDAAWQKVCAEIEPSRARLEGDNPPPAVR